MVDRASADATAFHAAPLIREIGRGAHGSRALTREQSRELMAAILDGAVGDLELGGVLIALRMKGETAAEIAGFLDALAPHLLHVPAHRPAVVLPTYNGARKLPNLVPLLACLLARRGVPVLLHGQSSEPVGIGKSYVRVNTPSLLTALGIAPCTQAEDATAHWAQAQPAYLPLATVAPGLARLIGLRRLLGVRNVSHTLAKLVRPVAGPSLLLASYTHPAFGAMLAELFAQTQACALLMRATEGEAVVHPERPQALEIWRGGERIAAAREEPANGDVVLPANSVEDTTRWTQAVLDGREPVPAAIAAQVELVLDEWRRLA
jgi:anthranilate phosphoribosyltransferase